MKKRRKGPVIRLSEQVAPDQPQPRRSAIVEPKRRPNSMLAHLLEDSTPEEHRRRGELADELFRTIVRRASKSDWLPDARRMLPQDGWLCLLVWCTACRHQAPADLQAIIDSGRGDVPLKDLKFRCTKCHSALTDAVVMSRDALAVQPWRREAG
jgi:hypothetical protein